MNKFAYACAALLAALSLSCPAFAAAPVSMTIRPNLVTIGTGFNGTRVTVTGAVPQGTSAVIRLLGEPRDKAFKKKGRALGLLWMNLGEVEIKGVPDVFLVGTDGASEINWEHSDLAFQSVKGDTEDWIYDEFIKLMEEDGFYEVENGIVQYTGEEEGMRSFRAELSIPSAMHQGVYRVEVLAVKDGRVADMASEELHTKLTGLPAFLSRLAFDHSLLYGVAAVVIAILAGLFMSLVFKERGGAH
ncbi:putative transmembrane protein [Pseudodesulfovibrio hydrargyri]|uniref:Putative transmembrane protein n=1 Tax=Pseudodesulfovibrio hydrargyri TaxID=2125990 RepID=A0A1J5NC27_9BACT|nr:TIGR02186 family protein [Pseudodesulfovibrio hydrargyri]OIQ52376.1 putative transmembrane protein [Pseudodesulfovibrio hydrargyri]